MRTFIIIWIGQFISLLGTGMTGFGIPIWVYGQTERATDLTTMGALYVGALLIVSPFVGVIVDRSNRKLTMMLSDLAAGLTTVTILVLYSLGRLEIWHLYISNVIQGAFQAFQWPAFSSAISVMVDKRHYTRASTMMDLAWTASQIFAPAVAGALLSFVGDAEGLELILVIDVVTFLVAIGTLLFVHVPQPAVTEEQKAAEEGGFVGELLFGFRYILKRPSLLGLQSVFLVGNFFSTIAYALVAPMILARTNSDELLFGSIQSVSAIGGLIGGIAISAWGGFKRQVHGVLLGWIISSLFAGMFGLGRPQFAWLWAASGFLGFFINPLINGSNQAIWQAKVPPDVQGKVFSIRRLVAWLVTPIANFAAGPLADRLLEPAMLAGGPFTRTFSWMVGTGPGAGMSLVFILAGVMGIAAGVGGYLIPAIRNAEGILPDHNAVVADSAEVGEPEPEPA